MGEMALEGGMGPQGLQRVPCHPGEVNPRTKALCCLLLCCCTEGAKRNW